MQVSRHTGPCYCFLIFGLSQSLPVSGLIKLNPVNYTTGRNGPSVQPKMECFSFLSMYRVLSSCCYCLVTKLYLTLLWPHGLQPTRLLCPQDFPGKNTGVGCHFIQGIFPTQGSNPCFLHCSWFLYHWATREAHKHECPALKTPGIRFLTTLLTMCETWESHLTSVH